MGRKKSKPIPPPTAPPPPAEDVSAEIVSPVMRRAASRRIQSTYTTRGQKMGEQGSVLGTAQQKFAAPSSYLAKPKKIKKDSM
jgi:hypothetical protein